MQKYDVNLVRSEIEMHKKNCSMQARLEAQQRREGNDMSPNALMQLAYIKDFTCLLCDTKGICVNIHPSMISAIHFWMENGFVQAPEMSNYVNAEDQRLIAYWKTLRYNETREN